LKHRFLQNDCTTAAMSSASVLSIRMRSPLRLVSSLVVASRGAIGAICTDTNFALDGFNRGRFLLCASASPSQWLGRFVRGLCT
jgi:hypothetical protein